RKAAFLQEAIRTLPLSGAVIEQARVEDIAERPDAQGSADILTVRAVRMDQALLDAAAKLVRAGGRVLLFMSDRPRALHESSLTIADTARLTDAAIVAVLERR